MNRKLHSLECTNELPVIVRHIDTIAVCASEKRHRKQTIAGYHVDTIRWRLSRIVCHVTPPLKVCYVACSPKIARVDPFGDASHVASVNPRILFYTRLQSTPALSMPTSARMLRHVADSLTSPSDSIILRRWPSDPEPHAEQFSVPASQQH